MEVIFQMIYDRIEETLYILSHVRVLGMKTNVKLRWDMCAVP